MKPTIKDVMDKLDDIEDKFIDIVKPKKQFIDIVKPKKHFYTEHFLCRRCKTEMLLKVPFMKSAIHPPYCPECGDHMIFTGQGLE